MNARDALSTADAVAFNKKPDDHSGLLDRKVHPVQRPVMGSRNVLEH